jgi:hypothetical protein
MRGVSNRRRPSPGGVVALLALIVALGGVAAAAIPGSDGTIRACYQKGNGNLRVVDSSGDCRPNEAPLDWNRTGERGATGATGATGSAGQSEDVTRFNVLASQGDEPVLASKGPLTLSLRCEDDEPGNFALVARVVVTTTRDHAAVTSMSQRSGSTGASGLSDSDLLATEEFTLEVVGASSSAPGVATTSFTATAPDGPRWSGQAQFGANLHGRPGTCTAAGFVVG